MRVILALLACVAVVGTASAAAAQPSASTLPSQAAIDAMSPAEFKAFLASPALNKENVLRAYHHNVHAVRGAACPMVENDGFMAMILWIFGAGR